jgi:hypothetical protein
MFRSVNVGWTAKRMIRENWTEIGQMASTAHPFRPAHWTSMAVDRLGQIAARMALAEGSDALHAADGLADLRIGRNVIAIRRTLPGLPAAVQAPLRDVLEGIASLFQSRGRKGNLLPPHASLLASIDSAIVAMCTGLPSEPAHPALLALVGMRCNLFSTAPAPRMPCHA